MHILDPKAALPLAFVNLSFLVGKMLLFGGIW